MYIINKDTNRIEKIETYIPQVDSIFSIYMLDEND